MTVPTRIAALVSLGSLFLAPAVFGQSTSQSNPTPSQADFDACNKQAEATVGAPSAAARPRTGPMVTGPGTPATGNPGSPAPSSSSDATAGAAGGGKDMRITGSDVPGAREAGLSGMAAAGQSDAAYQQAYRDCMKSRGF
jgi:hypothetical protein